MLHVRSYYCGFDCLLEFNPCMHVLSMIVDCADVFCVELVQERSYQTKEAWLTARNACCNAHVQSF